jgi:hypothetical protein
LSTGTQGGIQELLVLKVQRVRALT